jgi:serine protease SohB
MTEFLIDYGSFLVKFATVGGLLVALGIVLVRGLAGLTGEHDAEDKGELRVRSLNREIEKLHDAVHQAVLSDDAWKVQSKRLRKERKKRAKAQEAADPRRKRVYVTDFHGDLQASAVDRLRMEITAILSLAEAGDEIVLRLSSGGGIVHAYGLAASQLSRIREHGIPFTVCVDAIAASGGYMMACVADKLLAAPFAVIGSIGVVAQLPNFHRYLKNKDIDFELITAGEYKRTLTLFGENTEKGRAKFIEEIEETQQLFKSFVANHRPRVAIDEVSTGEHWYGQQAIERALVDEISTSDEYLVRSCEVADVYEVSYHKKKSLQQRFGLALDGTLARLFPERFARVPRAQAVSPAEML